MSQDYVSLWNNPINTGNPAFNVGGTSNNMGFSVGAPQQTTTPQGTSLDFLNQPTSSSMSPVPSSTPTNMSANPNYVEFSGVNPQTQYMDTLKSKVTDNWFTGGGADGQGSFGLLGDYGNDFLSLFGGQGNGADVSVTGSQLASNNAAASDWGWGDTVNADDTTTKGDGGNYIAAGTALMDAFFGFQNMNMAKDQLALQQDTFAFNKENILQDRADKKQFNQDVGAAIVS